MCRLLGFASPTARSVQEVLGADERAVFQDMARLHRDGWGTAWLSGEPGGVLDRERTAEAGLGLRRSPASGHGDEELTSALLEPAHARIVHLRMATDGMRCTIENTHPFVADGLAFGHNGSITPVDGLAALVSPEIRATLGGDTDSELYLGAIRTAIRAGSTVPDAVVDTVSRIRSMYAGASMNALLLTPTQLIAIHASTGSRVPTEDFDASGLDDHELPRDHRDAYYLMRMRRLDDGTTVFASSGLDIAQWQALPDESVAILDLRTLRVELRGLDRSSSRLAG